MSAIIHTVRSSLFGAEQTYRLDGDALLTQQNGTTTSLPYADMTKVQLITYGGAGGRQGQTTIKMRDGRRLKIRSHHYQSFGRFEDRSGSYRSLVRGLTERVSKANPDAAFVSGNYGLWMTWIVIAFLMVLVATGIVLAIVGGASEPVRIGIALLVVAATAPLIWRNVRSGKPRPFDPTRPPDELLQF